MFTRAAYRAVKSDPLFVALFITVTCIKDS